MLWVTTVTEPVCRWRVRDPASAHQTSNSASTARRWACSFHWPFRLLRLRARADRRRGRLGDPACELAGASQRSNARAAAVIAWLFPGSRVGVRVPTDGTKALLEAMCRPAVCSVVDHEVPTAGRCRARRPADQVRCGLARDQRNWRGGACVGYSEASREVVG